MAVLMITTWAACAAPAHDAEGCGLSQAGMRKGVSCHIRGCAQRRGSCGQGPCGHRHGLGAVCVHAAMTRQDCRRARRCGLTRTRPTCGNMGIKFAETYMLV